MSMALMQGEGYRREGSGSLEPVGQEALFTGTPASHLVSRVLAGSGGECFPPRPQAEQGAKAG